MVRNAHDGRVWFGDNFWGHLPDRTRPGREVRLNTAFPWNGRPGLIPAIYLCGRGVVADVCYSVPAAEADGFLARALAASGEEQERMAAERRAEFEATEVTAQEAAEPAPVEEDAPHEYQMTVYLTRTQLRQFTQSMSTLGIHGNLRRVN